MARVSSSFPSPEPMSRIWPGWTLAPKLTIRSARRARGGTAWGGDASWAAKGAAWTLRARSSASSILPLSAREPARPTGTTSRSSRRWLGDRRLGSRRCRRQRAHGLRGRPRARASAETRAGDDRAKACGGAELPQVHARADERAGRLAGAAPAAALPGHAEDRGGRGGARVRLPGDGPLAAAEPRARGARLFGRAAQRGGGRARSRRRRLRPRAASRQRQGRQGAARPARRGGGPSASRATSTKRDPSW